MNDFMAGELSIPLKKKMIKIIPHKNFKKLLQNQINVINSGSESDINNKMQLLKGTLKVTIDRENSEDVNVL